MCAIPSLCIGFEPDSDTTAPSASNCSNAWPSASTNLSEPTSDNCENDNILIYDMAYHIDTSVFLGNNTMCKVHSKLHLGSERHIFDILTSEDIDDIISQFIWSKKITWELEDINFIFLMVETIFYSVAMCLFIKYHFHHSKIKLIHIFVSPCNILLFLPSFLSCGQRPLTFSPTVIPQIFSRWSSSMSMTGRPSFSPTTLATVVLPAPGLPMSMTLSPFCRCHVTKLYTSLIDVKILDWFRFLGTYLPTTPLELTLTLPLPSHNPNSRPNPGEGRCIPRNLDWSKISRTRHTL